MTTFGGVSLAQDKVFVGTIIRSNVKGILFALNKNDGSEIWNVSFGRGGASKPAYSNGKVFVGTRDNRAIYSINSNNGSVFWSKGLAGWAGHPSVSDGKVYIMGGKTLYCLDEATGNTIWSQNFSSGSLAAPAIAYGKVFVGIGNSLYSLDKDSGAIILNASVGGIRSPLAISNEMVYFQSNSDIFNYDANTGDLISTYRMYSLGAPIAIGANRVYAAGNKKLYAFGGSDELDLSISDVKPVQVVYDADINGDGKIDLVQGKSAVALVYLDTENFEDLDND
ncbi:MAG: PQQ-binding-like beta-propeller repeat protein [Candidatus Altiarchaeota archaeon]|nr:PQQ-binding-like beta-propeller repeat protein [Candidatus Altiarchaeota archaeon]